MAQSLDALLPWFDAHKRDLPWRRTDDPWAIWVSEVMLQQTQVATVVPYYLRWLQRFPRPQALAEADEQEALALWQGLGYYRRCRLLQKGARHVVEHGYPEAYEGWLKVPGVGPYTAGAIASIAFGVPVPVVDGNVERVYARLRADRKTGAELHRNAWKWSRKVLDKKRPGAWNEALMELGATVCRPGKPDCPRCPVETACVGRMLGLEESLPTRQAPPKVVKLRHAVWVPVFEGKFGVVQIPEGQWWEGMWEFPRAESEGPMEVPELRELVGPGWLQTAGQIHHTVTRHKITIDVSLIRCETRSERLRWETAEGLARLPMPTPQRRCLKAALLRL
ncbi:MAG TPA: A/G-specific adenine glycosylase [Fimbriimonas sp.]